MFDLKHPKISDFEIVEAPQHHNPSGRVRLNFYRVRRGDEVIERTEHKVGDLPKEIYELFKNRV